MQYRRAFMLGLAAMVVTAVSGASAQPRGLPPRKGPPKRGRVAYVDRLPDGRYRAVLDGRTIGIYDTEAQAWAALRAAGA